MPQNDAPALTLFAKRMAAIKSEIDMIFADAERRAGPLRAKLQRLQIADEELRDLDPAQTVLTLDAPLDAVLTNNANKTPARRTVRSLVEEELRASALPLSKAELVGRFFASGHSLSDATVGSTLSRMVADGALIKADGNRYTIKPADPAADQEEGGAAR